MTQFRRWASMTLVLALGETVAIVTIGRHALESPAFVFTYGATLALGLCLALAYAGNEGR